MRKNIVNIANYANDLKTSIYTETCYILIYYHLRMVIVETFFHYFIIYYFICDFGVLSELFFIARKSILYVNILQSKNLLAANVIKNRNMF